MESIVSKLGGLWVLAPVSLVVAVWVAAALVFLPSSGDESLATETPATEQPAGVTDPGVPTADRPPSSERPSNDPFVPEAVSNAADVQPPAALPLIDNPESSTTVAPTSTTDNVETSTTEAPQSTTTSTTAAPDVAPTTTDPATAPTTTSTPSTSSTTTTTTTTTTIPATAAVVAAERPVISAISTDGAAASPPPAPVVPNGSPSGRLTGVVLFTDPTNSAAEWAADNPDDPRSNVIASAIGDQPMARWFGEWSGDITAAVSQYVEAAREVNAVPMLVVYNIPDRDCGQHSAGGATNFDEYDEWIAAFASGLNDEPAIIILEPDAIALNGCAGSERNEALSNAIDQIKFSCAQCRVYLDAGHSDWVSPEDMAERLRSAGVLHADGFATNVSNYNLTIDEATFGERVLAALGDPTGVGQVIDVSRNGNGSNGEWCDVDGRAIGTNPTVSTDAAHVHAHLWIKTPGEADGCAGAAGEFVPDLAYELATGGAAGSQIRR